jgi:hypothetical protein
MIRSTAGASRGKEALMVHARQRWDDDDRGHGVAGGDWIAADVARLLDTLSEPDWVAEAPDQHLRPQLERACAAADSPWSLTGTEARETVYVVFLKWNCPDGRARDLRADAFALLGQIAESVTYVRQRVEGNEIVFDAVTGMLEGDGRFRGHGHLVQIRICGEAVDRMIVGMGG